MIIIAGVLTYFLYWLVIPTKTIEIPEATPYTFERDKAVENANETFNAWAELRRQIDIEKKGGAVKLTVDNNRQVGVKCTDLSLDDKLYWCK